MLVVIEPAHLNQRRLYSPTFRSVHCLQWICDGPLKAAIGFFDVDVLSDKGCHNCNYLEALSLEASPYLPTPGQVANFCRVNAGVRDFGKKTAIKCRKM
jgi:hypothetical protein